VEGYTKSQDGGERAKRDGWGSQASFCDGIAKKGGKNPEKTVKNNTLVVKKKPRENDDMTGGDTLIRKNMRRGYP